VSVFIQILKTIYLQDADRKRYLLAEKAFTKIKVFEQRATVGGIWNYVPCPEGAPKDQAIPQTNPFAGLDEPIWHSNAKDTSSKQDRENASFLSPLYDRLETNIPRGLMGYSDLPWSKDAQLFPKHTEVQNYIEQYSQEVRHLIQFQTQVLDLHQEPSSKWTIKTKSITPDNDAEVSEHHFDAVVVANGHFNIPYIPKVTGIEAFSKAHPGTISHSKFYRLPEQYSGKKVVIVGNSASGIDIAGQIMPHCHQPLISSSKSESYLQLETPPGQLDKPPISRFHPENRTIEFEDGSRESNVDTVLYCTGYFYSFPFISGLNPPLITTGERVENLYQHLFYRPNPSLAFPVLSQKIIPFPFAEAQAAVIARTFAGRLALPSEAEMKAWEESVKAEMGEGRGFHVLKFPKDADHINMLHDWALSADDEPCGRKPPYWGEKEYWTRERFPAIKKAFQALGEDRHEVRSLTEVGFDFEQWKREKDDEGVQLL
jgi:cation diffusion facilitator CzcD-associated flavoprotein CzcO